jgi:hypothetical protein
MAQLFGDKNTRKHMTNAKTILRQAWHNGAKWQATDYDGAVYAYYDKPMFYDDEGIWRSLFTALRRKLLACPPKNCKATIRRIVNTRNMYTLLSRRKRSTGKWDRKLFDTRIDAIAEIRKEKNMIGIVNMVYKIRRATAREMRLPTDVMRENAIKRGDNGISVW